MRKTLIEQIRSPLYKNSLFLIADNAVTAGLGFFFWMVVARFYSESDVGYGSATISAIILLSTLSLAGLGTTLIRFLPKAEKSLDLINTCLTLSAIISLVFSIIFICGLEVWSPALSFIRRDPIFGAAFVFYTLAFSSSSILDAVFIARRKAHLVLILDMISSFLKIPLPFLLVLFFHSFGIASSAGISVAVAVLAGLFFIARLEKGFKPWPRLSPGIVRSFWHYSTGTYLATLLWSAPGWVLPIMVVNVIGARQNAYYYITWTLYNLLSAISAAASSSLFAEGSHGADLRTNTLNTIKLVYILLIPSIVIILICGNWILSLFGAAYSSQGLALLRVLAFASIFVGINTIYYTILRVENRIKELCFICAFQSTMVLAASYFMSTRTGIVGIGYAWLGSHAIISLYVFFAMRKVFRLNSPTSDN